MMIHAKKSLGQNWLVNEGVAKRIVDAAAVTSDDVVLEIGPGTGVLTALLAERARKVIALEKDTTLIAPLRGRFADSSVVHIEEGDALTFDPAPAGLAPDSYLVVANLPYYITSHFIRRLLSEWPRPSRTVLMVQKEVAERMTASAPDMNLLALSVALHADVERIMVVSRGSFRPAPDVDSAVIRIVPHALSDDGRALRENALRLARKAFGQKRKQLTATIDAHLLEQCGIAPTARPQELAPDAWLRLAETASD